MVRLDVFKHGGKGEDAVETAGVRKGGIEDEHDGCREGFKVEKEVDGCRDGCKEGFKVEKEADGCRDGFKDEEEVGGMKRGEGADKEDEEESVGRGLLSST